MKQIILATGLLVSTFAQAESSYFCKALIRENNVTSAYSFKFKCDNYGDKSTVISKSGRFKVMAFSEESCTPQLIIQDQLLKVGSASITLADNDPFSVFNSRVVQTYYVVQSEKTAGKQDTVVVGCSDNKKQLDKIKLD